MSLSIMSHVHTPYSDGMLDPDRLEADVVLIADHGIAYSSVARHLRSPHRYPLIGAEIYLTGGSRNHHLTVFAYSKEGLRNLFRMLENPPRVDDFFALPMEGLIVGTGCPASPFYEAVREDLGQLLQLRDAVRSQGGILAFEVFPYDVAIAHPIPNDIPVLYSADLHVRHGGADIMEAYQIFLSIRPDSGRGVGGKIHPIKGGSGFADKMTEVWDMISSAHDPSRLRMMGWLERYFPSSPLMSVSLPVFPDSEFEDLKAWAMGVCPPDRQERLEYEIRVIEQSRVGDSRLKDYFVLLRRVFLALDRKGVFYSVRGSGAGSVLIWLMAHGRFPDPVDASCIFERFVNPYRVSLPDVDIDVSNQEKAIEALRAEMDVYRLSAYTRLGPEDLHEIYRILAIRETRTQVRKENAEKILKSATGERFAQIAEAVRTIFSEIPEIITRISQHAGGLLVIPKGIEYDPIPVFPESVVKSAGGIPVTMLDMDLCPWKIDILQVDSLEAIYEISRPQRADGESEGGFVFVPEADPYPLKVGTAGIFQLHTHRAGPILYLLSLEDRPITFEDAVTLVACIRPGAALGTGLERLGLMKYETFLRKIYWGDIYIRTPLLFQEDLMQRVREIALGIGLSEQDAWIIADLARKAQAKKDAAAWESVRSKLQPAGDAILEIEQALGYGFNRAHASSYAAHVMMSLAMLSKDPIPYLIRVARNAKKRMDYAEIAHTILNIATYALKMGLGVRVGVGGESRVDHDAVVIGDDILKIPGWARLSGIRAILYADGWRAFEREVGIPILSILLMAPFIAFPKNPDFYPMILIPGEVKKGSKMEPSMISPYGVFPKALQFLQDLQDGFFYSLFPNGELKAIHRLKLVSADDERLEYCKMLFVSEEDVLSVIRRLLAEQAGG